MTIAFSLNENDEIDERRDVQFAKSVLDADSPKKNRTKDFPVYSVSSSPQGFGDSASFEANDTACFNIWANSSFDDDIIAALDEPQGGLHFPNASWPEERSHFLKNMMGVCFARFYSIFDVFDIEPAEEHVLALDWGDVNSLASAAALSSDSIWESLVSTEERLKHRNCPASPTSEPIAPKRQHLLD